MPIEKSAGAVIFRREGTKRYFFTLQYASESRIRAPFWDFPKGHVEKGESLEETVLREVFEETGLTDLEIIKGFKTTIRYFFKLEGKNILKFVTLFLLETKGKEIKLSFEHIGFKWLEYEEALKQLTHKNAKEILMKANQFLSNG